MLYWPWLNGVSWLLTPCCCHEWTKELWKSLGTCLLYATTYGGGPFILILLGDVRALKQFPQYWLLVMRIHRSPNWSFVCEGNQRSPPRGYYSQYACNAERFMFSLLIAGTSWRTFNRVADDLRRYVAHVTSLYCQQMAVLFGTVYPKVIVSLATVLCVNDRTGIILRMSPANETRLYTVMPSLID